MKLRLPSTLALIFLFFSLKVLAGNIRIDGTDTMQISRLIERGKKYKQASDGKNLLIIAHQLAGAGKARNSKVGQLYANLFGAHSGWLSSNYPEALSYALDALSQSKKWQINNFLPEIYSIIGTVYKENLDYPKAMVAVEQEVQSAKQNKDTLELLAAYREQAMFMHGYAFRRKDKAMAKRSFELHLKGLALAKTNSKFERQSIGYYSNIAQYYLDQHDYDNCIKTANAGVTLALKYKQYKSLTYQYNWLGAAYFGQGNQAKGISWIEQALALCKKYHFIFREMEVYSSLEDCYAKTRDYKKAWEAGNRWQEIHDSLNIIKNVQKLDELSVKYQTAEQNARIALLKQSERNKNVLFVIGGFVVIVLLIFMVLLYRQKQHLLAGNKTIKDQAGKLELLLKELHHRVKNNLQIVTSLLKLQSNRLTDEDAKIALLDSQQRIEAMSLIHRTLYQQENSSLVNMKQFVTDLVTSVMASFGLRPGDINFNLNIDADEMDIDVALPLGLIINELVINAFKHAYPFAGKNFKLNINLLCKADCRLEISDNGPGIDPALWAAPKSSFGIKLIKLLTQQLGGQSNMLTRNGTFFELVIARQA